MKHLYKLALCLALLIGLAALAGTAPALAAETTVTYTFDHVYKNKTYTDYIVCNGTKYQLYNGNVNSWSNAAVTIDGLTVTITEGSYGEISAGTFSNNLVAIYPVANFNFSHPSKYITHVKINYDANIGPIRARRSMWKSSSHPASTIST